MVTYGNNMAVAGRFLDSQKTVETVKQNILMKKNNNTRLTILPV